MEEHDAFYLDMIKTPNSWANAYYGVFEKAIQENGFKVVAEVGIGYGFHAKSVLDNTSIDKLYLIDPSTFYPNDNFASDVAVCGGFDKLIKNIKLNLKPHDSRYTWFRQPSLSITNEQIPDESLDSVFLDGDHSYEAVSLDLSFWFKKVRKGGWMLGDDYAYCCPGVTKAVDEFAKSNNLALEFLYKPGTSYPIFKFVK